MYGQDLPYIRFLENNGFRFYLLQSKFVVLTVSELLKRYSNVLQERALRDVDYNRILRLLESDAFELRYPELKKTIVTHLLAPFLQTDKNLSLPQREILMDFILRHYGDPRYHRDAWPDIPKEFKAVILRWLKNVSIRKRPDYSGDTGL